MAASFKPRDLIPGVQVTKSVPGINLLNPHHFEVPQVKLYDLLISIQE